MFFSDPSVLGENGLKIGLYLEPDSAITVRIALSGATKANARMRMVTVTDARCRPAQ